MADDNHIINSCNENIVNAILKENQELDLYEILLVTDGYDIIKNFLNDEIREKVQFLITDENMDFLNGSESIKFIRNYERLKNSKKITLISLSGNEDGRMKEYLIKCGADNVLNKPLTKNNVRQIFQEVKKNN